MDRLRRVLRGGSWRNYQDHCRAVYRSRVNHNSRYVSIGFRLVGVEDE